MTEAAKTDNPRDSRVMKALAMVSRRKLGENHKTSDLRGNQTNHDRVLDRKRLRPNPIKVIERKAL